MCLKAVISPMIPEVSCMVISYDERNMDRDQLEELAQWRSGWPLVGRVHFEVDMEIPTLWSESEYAIRAAIARGEVQLKSPSRAPAKPPEGTVVVNVPCSLGVGVALGGFEEVLRGLCQRWPAFMADVSGSMRMELGGVLDIN